MSVCCAILELILQSMGHYRDISFLTSLCDYIWSLKHSSSRQY